MDIEFPQFLNSKTVVAHGRKLGRNLQWTFTRGHLESCTIMVCFLLSSLGLCAC
jgi:hypothetical protein